MGVKGDGVGDASDCVVDGAIKGNSAVLVKGPTACSMQKQEKGVPKGTGKTEGLYHFDRIFNSTVPGEASQENVFETMGPDMLDATSKGYNVCLMAYGQTSSGKTYTMTGGDDFKNPAKRGVIPRFLDGLFARMQGKEATQGNVHFKLEASYMEIYNEQVKDLLNPGRGKRLQVREHPEKGPFADGVKTKQILSPQAILQVLESGNKMRHTRSTKMNDTSSRSHAILQLHLTQYVTEEAVNEEEGPMTSTIVSKINLVDLAGSERQKSTGAEGGGLKEAIHINTALHCLRKVIDALTSKVEKGKPRNPGALRSLQRESILTWLLADSLGGNSRTVLVATVSPAASNYSETLSTLRYASAAREIENTVKVNSDGQTAVITALEDEIDRLKRELREAQTRAVDSREIDAAVQEQERLRVMLESTHIERLGEREELEMKLEDLEEENRGLHGKNKELLGKVQEVQEVAQQVQQSTADEDALTAQIDHMQVQLRAAREDQSQQVQHQNELSTEIAKARHEVEGKAQQVLGMQRDFTRHVERLVKGQPQWEKLMKDATKPSKGKGGGAGDPLVVEMAFTRLQNLALTETLDTMNEALTAAYTENARMASMLQGTMQQIADYENANFQDKEKDATIRRLQKDLVQANAKEEKYLGQLKDLSLEHLMLQHRLEGGNHGGVAPMVQTRTELPEDLKQACEFFGFNDPIVFSKWVVKTLGYTPDGQNGEGAPPAEELNSDDEYDMPPPEAAAPQEKAKKTSKLSFKIGRKSKPKEDPGSSIGVTKSDLALKSDGAFSLRSTAYVPPQRAQDME
eukprot:TRINITY_DN11623_c0_g1_i3.p1 TRINITY_DN11623_c0_g1~~TRINITY_DN11623_c0_g1_i3.p1  ORF type:complete len:804 (+),score=358.61 TRINITY_DN11623_c0_g1_i3:301-2712(+)